jgi:hypothetical protein
MTPPLRLENTLVPRRRFVPLGQAAEATGTDLDGYLRALRSELRSSFAHLVDAFRAYRDVRGVYRLSTESDPGFAADQQRVVELGGVVDVASKALDDAAAGKRRIGFDAQGFAVEALPGDAARVDVQGGDPVLVDSKTGQRVVVTGTIDGHLGAIQVPIALLVAAGVVVTAGTIYVAVKSIELLTTALQERTTQVLSTERQKMVEQGFTPEQAAQAQSASLKAQAGLEQARTERDKGSTEDVTSSIRTVAIVGAVIAGLYFAARVIPEIAPRRAVAA